MSSVFAVVETKASYSDLENATSALMSADKKLARDIEHLTDTVSQTSQNLASSDALYRSTFAYHTAVAEVSESVQDLKQHVAALLAKALCVV